MTVAIPWNSTLDSCLLCVPRGFLFAVAFALQTLDWNTNSLVFTSTNSSPISDTFKGRGFGSGSSSSRCGSMSTLLMKSSIGTFLRGTAPEKQQITFRFQTNTGTAFLLFVLASNHLIQLYTTYLEWLSYFLFSSEYPAWALYLPGTALILELLPDFMTSMSFLKKCL